MAITVATNDTYNDKKTISKNFEFTEPKDFQGRFGGPEILARILKQAPALYARYKSLLGGRGINLEQYTNKPMKYKFRSLNRWLKNSKKNKKSQWI